MMPPQGGNGNGSVRTFEEWKSSPSANSHLSNVELLSALVWGELTIQSSEGSSIKLQSDFEVDSAGLVETTVELNMPERRLFSPGIEYPDGPVQANFFQTDNVKVGEPFTIMTYDREKRQRVIAVLGTVAQLTIFPHPTPK